MRLPRRSGAAALAAAMALLTYHGPARADTLTLESGVVYEGIIDKDGTTLTVYDGLKRVVVRETKVESRKETARPRFETFRVEQPLVVHGGKMPVYAINVRAGPWDETGRRTFEYIGPGSARPVRMTQAINEIGPKTVRIRGVDGFWRAELATDQVPRSVILGLLAKVDQSDQNERLKVGQFLIQAEWFDEALAELDRLERDFPDLTETVAKVRRMVVELQARGRLEEIARQRRAQQFRALRRDLESFPLAGLPETLQAEVRAAQADEQRQAQADRALARAVREAAEALPADLRGALRAPTLAMLRDLAEAPDAVRDRFGPFLSVVAAPAPIAPEVSVESIRPQPTRSPTTVPAPPEPSPPPAPAGPDADGSEEPGPEGVEGESIREPGSQEGAATSADLSAEAHYALALSGWVAGAEAAVADLDAARTLWAAREALQEYLTSRSEGERSSALETLRGLAPTGMPDSESGSLGPALLTQIAQRMPPPGRDAATEDSGEPRRLRARDDENPEPTEYVVVLPPEYHPQRNYPALIVLHGGDGPEAVASWWRAEAARRGTILIAPEYNLSGQPRDYRYTPSEHAAVEIALRDARKRFAIDSDRVFLAGTVLGGNMAWDFGLAHPDLFAGVAVISGLPARYVWAYRDNAKLVPLYVTMGDLAPAESEVIFPFGLSLVARNYDVVLTEYYNRGLEPLAEEIPHVFDWLESRRRDPYPKEFRTVSARSCDNRFYGLVLREHASGRSVPPDQADPLGKNLKPAVLELSAHSLANLLNVTTSGVAALDIWLGPPHIDLDRRLEIRINGRTAYKGQPTVDIAPFLEDLRLRGDRQQVYWLRYATDVSGRRR